MKKVKKLSFIIIAFVIVIFALLFFSPKLAKTYSKQKAFSYVQNNHTELTQLAQDIVYGKIKTPHQQGNYTVQYFKSPSTASEPVVEFNGHSFGIAPSGYYTGFYYSPKDIPVRHNGSGTAMEAYKNGWAYHESGDNHGYTEKICDNWYWFEFYF